MQSHVPSTPSAGGQAGGHATRRCSCRDGRSIAALRKHTFSQFSTIRKDGGEHTPARCLAADASFLIIFGKSSVEEKKDGNNSPLGCHADRVVSLVVGANPERDVGKGWILSCIVWDCIEPMAIYAPLDIVGLGKEKKKVTLVTVTVSCGVAGCISPDLMHDGGDPQTLAK